MEIIDNGCKGSKDKQVHIHRCGWNYHKHAFTRRYSKVGRARLAIKQNLYYIISKSAGLILCASKKKLSAAGGIGFGLGAGGA